MICESCSKANELDEYVENVTGFRNVNGSTLSYANYLRTFRCACGESNRPDKG